MRKLWFILKKETLLLIRDIPGLIILFLMPVLLIFVVTLAQDKALKDLHEKTRILFVDLVQNEFSGSLRANLDSSGIFIPVATAGNRPVTPVEARRLTGKGEFPFAVILLHPDSGVVLLTDPALKENYRASVASSLTFVIKGTQAGAAMNEMLKGLPPALQPAVRASVEGKMKHLPPVRERFAMADRSDIRPNVIQNNVPGFILFAMFFVVIPLAGSLISEKNEGSFRRLRSLPVSLGLLLSGKVVAYLAICLVQFALMIFIGTVVFPACCGLPALDLGSRHLAILVATLGASLAAIGFGILVGATASTHNQAGLFGSVMVVILGIISGTFFPVHLMPGFIRFISHASPVRWGIDNYLDLFIRDGNLLTILPRVLLLVLFFVFAMIASIAIFARHK